MLRASYLASILAAARGFGSTPHAVENACRNKETPVAVSHAEMIADCVAAVKYCPATCGRCDVEAPSDRHGGRGLNDKCIST